MLAHHRTLLPLLAILASSALAVVSATGAPFDAARGVGSASDLASYHGSAHAAAAATADVVPLVYARQQQTVPDDVCEEWGDDDDEDEEEDDDDGAPVMPAPAPVPAPAPAPIQGGNGNGGGNGSGGGAGAGGCTHGEWRCSGSALEICHYADMSALSWVKLHDCPKTCSVGASIQCE